MTLKTAHKNDEGSILMDKYYKNYISLGYFCGVAQDLEKMGLRNQSSPFDWGISNFENVIDAIDNKFYGFMDYENLSQDVNIRNHYRDDLYRFYFFHDFSQYRSLDKQYEEVKNKYYRRINRFLQTIKEPTLFVRYISTEELDENNKSVELKWIECNYKRILSVLRKYNPENDIIFIGDEILKSNIIKIYMVKRDEGDVVSRIPIINNKELYPILSSIDFPGKKENIERYNRKNRMKKSFHYRLKSMAIGFFSHRFLRVYEHTKTYGVQKNNCS